MARLQAKLRETEAIPASRRRAARSALRRTAVLLPPTLLNRVRDRAARDAVTLSDLIRDALEHYLATH